VIGELARELPERVDYLGYLGQYPSYLTFNLTLFRIATQYERFLERHQRLHALRGWILCMLSKRESRAS
jgi:hypothetical protein